MQKEIKLTPPVFTEEKLEQLLHYTDLPDNPSFNSYKSNAFFKLYCGAKGVSKSFGRMIETVYRLVNEKNFCSVWCRNQYNHIKNTLIPTLQKVLDFLATEHNLDYRPYFEIYSTGAYWTFDDGGLGRAIFFQNWEKIQAFQGFTLPKRNFRFGELVIDEPLEEIDETGISVELQKIYKIQKNNLDLLIQNTVLRESVEDNFHINVSFLYNIFDVNHFIVKEYHNPYLNFFDYDNAKPNEHLLNEIITKTFLQISNDDAFNGLGIIISMFSKNFVPSSTISPSQRVYLNKLKEENYKKWIVTVAGFGYLEQSNKTNYFLRNFIFNENNKVKKEFLNKKTDIELKMSLKDRQYLFVADGFDPGLSDSSSWVRVALRKDGVIEVLKCVPDIRKLIKNVNRDTINAKLIDLIKEDNKEWFDVFRPKYYFSTPDPILYTDNDILKNVLNQEFKNNDITGMVKMANRRDTKNIKFGILSRQEWQKWIFEHKLINFTKEAVPLLSALASQYILPGELKRFEEGDKENRDIYNVINAFEMAVSDIHWIQMSLIANGKD